MLYQHAQSRLEAVRRSTAVLTAVLLQWAAKLPVDKSLLTYSFGYLSVYAVPGCNFDPATPNTTLATCHSTYS